MATKTLPQLEKQIAALQRRADAIKKKQAKGVVARIKEAIVFYRLTPVDLGFGGVGRKAAAAGPAKAAKAPAVRKGRGRKAAGKIRFRDGAGNAWTGHGRRPKWFVDALAAGKTREDMAV